MVYWRSVAGLRPMAPCSSRARKGVLDLQGEIDAGARRLDS